MRRADGTVYGLTVDAPRGATAQFRNAAHPDVAGHCTVEALGPPDPPWPQETATRLLELHFDDGSCATTIDVHDNAGYRMWSAGYGDFRLTADGRHVSFHASEPQVLPWERFLLAQVLPLAALLQGLEPLHAAAVGIGGRVVAIAGASGAGKSSVVAHLIAQSGAALVCDDVMVVELHGDGLRAHSGPSILSIRHDEHGSMDSAERKALGPVLDGDAHKAYYTPAGVDRPLPLAALYLIERSDAGGELQFGELRDARALLATTFNTIVRAPDRLRRQLDVAATLAAGLAWRVRVPGTVDARAVAAAILARPAGPAAP